MSAIDDMCLCMSYGGYLDRLGSVKGELLNIVSYLLESIMQFFQLDAISCFKNALSA